MGTIRAYIAGIVGALSPGFLSGDLGSQSMVFFSILAAAILVVKFWWDVMEENSKRKGPDKIEGLLNTLRFLGMRLFLVPLIVFASAIPLVFAQITPSGFAATGSVANRVAGIGDNLIDKISSVYGLYVDKKIEQVLNPATLQATGLPEADRKNLETIQQQYWASDWNYKEAKSRVDELQTKKAMYKASPSGTGKLGWTAAEDKELQAAQKALPQAETAFNKASMSIATAQNTILPKIQNAKDKTELDTLKAKLAGLSPTIHMTARGGMGASAGGEFRNSEYYDTLGSIQRLETKLKTGSDPGDPNQGILGKTWDATTAVADFIGHIGFYACMLPAFLGLIAGAIVCLKEALGLVQFGAKLEIMKNLTLGLASAFGPLFMLGFLFQKTEQFAWKFVTLMFSIYFSFIGVSYVCGTVLGPGFETLKPLFDGLTSISLTKYGQQASMELFVGAVKIGLKGLGVGMITAFILDVVKSSVSVGQSLFNGTFSAS